MSYVIIDPKYCKGCRLCIEACKFGCLVSSGKLNNDGYDYVEFVKNSKCTACCACRTVCPDVAITVFKEKY